MKSISYLLFSYLLLSNLSFPVHYVYHYVLCVVFLLLAFFRPGDNAEHTAGGGPGRDLD